MSSVLRVENVTMQFGGVVAINNLSMEVNKGEIVALIGPNGAGKTTVFNLLTKVYQPTHGTILLDGQDTHNMTTAQVNRAGIARTFQNIRLFNDLTVEENVTVAMDAQMKYNMVSGIFRLPSFWKEEKVAHERALELLNNSEFSVKVLQLPRRLVDGEYIKQDADDFIKFQGPTAFERLLTGSENGVEFRLDQIAGKYDLTDDTQRIAYAQEVSEELAKLENAVEREVYTTRAAQAAGLTPEAMRLEVERTLRRKLGKERKALRRRELNPAVSVQPQERGIRYTNVRSAMAEEGVLRLLLKDESVFPEEAPLRQEEFSSPLLGRVFDRLWQLRQGGRPLSVAGLSGELSGEEMSHLTGVLQKPEATASAQRALADYIRIIREEAQKRNAQGDPLLAAQEKYKEKKGYGGKQA